MKKYSVALSLLILLGAIYWSFEALMPQSYTKTDAAENEFSTERGGPGVMLVETNGGNSELIKHFADANPKYPMGNSLAYSIYKMMPNDTDLMVFREDANMDAAGVCMTKKTSLLCLLVSSLLVPNLLMQTICSTESNDVATPVDQNREGSTKDSSAMAKSSEKQTPRIDPFQQVVNLGTYFEYFGLMRPANASDVERIGYKGDKNIPGLIVFAREHPALARPRLSVQTLEGEPVLVLTFLSFDISQGTLTEETPMVFAAGVHGPIPKQFVVRWVSSSEEFEAPLRQVEGESIALKAETVAVSEGPGVSFAPWGTPLVYTQFFEQLGLPARPEMTDANFAVAVKPTASGEQSAAASVTLLAEGGTRLKIHIPIDPGGSLWGPRSGEAATLYTYTAGPGSIECLIEL